MSYKVLYRKYRPDSFDNVVGQKYTVDMLKNAVITGKHAHAYIFTGPRGTGKTSCAKLFAKALNCDSPIDGNPCSNCISCSNFIDNPDIIELDAASNNGVDQIRDLIDSVRLVPSNSKYKIYIIDEVHMLSTSAFNALLLTLEEPPEHVVFILATTDIQKVPITILSRCQRFDFKPISKEDIINRLRYICDTEDIKADDDALSEIAVLSSGGMRDALGMLDQLSCEGESITLDLVTSYFGTISNSKIMDVIHTLEDNDSNKLIKLLEDIKASGVNYSVLVEKMVSCLRDYAIDIKSGKVNNGIDFDSVINLIFDLNESLSNTSNVKIDPFILIEVIILKYVNRDEKYFPGNKQQSVDFNSDVISNDNKSISEVDDSKASNVPKTKELDSTENNSKSTQKEVVINNKIVFDTDLRISNCFSEADKSKKESLITLWNDFVSSLKKSDKKVYALLSDTVIQAASDKYAIITSKIDSTNELINSSIDIVESLFRKFNNNTYRFVALNEDSWKNEVKKYRENVKNKIKYIYVEENIDYESEEVIDNTPKSDIEQLGEDVFGSILKVE